MIRLALPLVLLLAAAPALAQPGPEGVDPDRAALLIATVRANDCAMTEDEAAATLPGLSYEMAESQAIVSVLLDAGLVGFDENRLILAPELCTADPAGDAALFATAAEGYGSGDAPTLADENPETVIAVLRESLGMGFVRGAVEFLAENRACVIDFADPDATRADLVAYLAGYVGMIYGLPEPLDAAVTAELGDMVDAFRADPGPSFLAQDNRLLLDGCEP